SFAAERFLTAAAWEESIQAALEQLNQATGASRIYIFENHIAEDGTLLTSQRHEWAAPGITSQIDNPELQDFPLLAGGFARWVQTLGRDQPLYGHVREFPESEREVLATQDIRSIAVVPIFAGQAWWGFIGFDECLAEREWSAPEINALKAAADILGAAIQRKRSEQVLRQAEEKYRGIFENALEGIFQISLDERFLTANPALAHMLGYASPTEFITTVTDTGRQLYVEPERQKEFKRLLEKRGLVQGFETQVYRKNRSKIWISVNARAIRDSHGTTLYYEGTAEDIAEDVQVRKAAKPSTLFLRSLGIFGTVDILVMFILSFLHIPTGIWEYLLDALLLTILSAPIAYFWIVKGMTRHLVREMTVAQTEARAQEQRYRVLAEVAPDVIYTLAAEDGTITSLNPAFEKLTGLSSDDWIGKPFHGLVHPDDLPLAVQTFEQVLRGETPSLFELRILSKSGKYLVGEFTNVPQIENGKIIGEFGIARDITDRKQAEEALRQAEEKYRGIFENAVVGIFQTTLEGRYLIANPTLARIYSYESPEELMAAF
ncbi:MAG: PAS domain S-box protein, partial [Chloroflexota bacterium]